MRTAITIAALLVAAGALADEPFAPTRHEDQWAMRVQEMSSLTSLRAKCEDMGAKVGTREAGCATFDPNVKLCTIYVLKLESSEARDQMWVWGHELAHCKYGRYHTVEGAS